MEGVTERAQFFGREGNLLGIFSEPEDGATRSTSVVILNAGIIHRVGPSRFVVELSRALAGAGYRVLRLDLSGIGDSRLPARDGTLEAIVREDIADAIELADDGATPGGVVLLGLCSGADNSFHVAPLHDRVRGLALIDPMVHETPRYRRQKALNRLRSPRSWWNVISGRSLLLRIRQARSREPVRPPHYYGLLTDSAEESRRKADLMQKRGMHLLYLLTGGAHRYCNHPGQVADALGIDPASPLLRVEWRPEASHILTRAEDRTWLNRTVCAWLEGIGGERKHDPITPSDPSSSSAFSSLSSPSPSSPASPVPSKPTGI